MGNITLVGVVRGVASSDRTLCGGTSDMLFERIILPRIEKVRNTLLINEDYVGSTIFKFYDEEDQERNLQKYQGAKTAISRSLAAAHHLKPDILGEIIDYKERYKYGHTPTKTPDSKATLQNWLRQTGAKMSGTHFDTIAELERTYLDKTRKTKTFEITLGEEPPEDIRKYAQWLDYNFKNREKNMVDTARLYTYTYPQIFIISSIPHMLRMARDYWFPHIILYKTDNDEDIKNLHKEVIATLELPNYIAYYGKNGTFEK